MNKVILMGRLTRDPEVRYTQTNNTVVASFSLAVNRRFAKQGEERQADFINIVAWSKLGEFCSKYFKKGQQVGIIGRIQEHGMMTKVKNTMLQKLLPKKLILQIVEEMEKEQVLHSKIHLEIQCQVEQILKYLQVMTYHFRK